MKGNKRWLKYTIWVFIFPLLAASFFFIFNKRNEYSQEPGMPTDIMYKSMFSDSAVVCVGAPRDYTVKCSNGNKLIITSWNNRSKWCIGLSNMCSDSQLKTAKLACQKNYKFSLPTYYRRLHHERYTNCRSD